jgi:curved DNA-binding protein CbpA
MNPYDVLGVAKDATAAQIKAAFRQLAKNFHPDRNAGNQDAADRYKVIVDAYELLSDSQRRAAYDATGRTRVDPQEHQVLLSILVPALNEAIQSTDNGFGTGTLKTKDMVAAIRVIVTGRLTHIETQYASMSRGRDALDTAIGRFESEDPADLLNNALRTQLKNLLGSMDACKMDMDRHVRALAYLKTVKYRRDGTPDFSNVFSAAKTLHAPRKSIAEPEPVPDSEDDE